MNKIKIKNKYNKIDRQKDRQTDRQTDRWIKKTDNEYDDDDDLVGRWTIWKALSRDKEAVWMWFSSMYGRVVRTADGVVKQRKQVAVAADFEAEFGLV